eukprot:scaffold419644_cov41-Prasinocladus_malaysianus.AAC.1
MARLIPPRPPGNWQPGMIRLPRTRVGIVTTLGNDCALFDMLQTSLVLDSQLCSSTGTTERTRLVVRVVLRRVRDIIAAHTSAHRRIRVKYPGTEYRHGNVRTWPL